MRQWHGHLFIYTPLEPSSGHECIAMNDTRFTFEEALREMPIPNPACKRQINRSGHAMCGCTWMVDLDGVRLAREASDPPR